MNAREAILHKIRQNLPYSSDPERKKAVEARLLQSPAGVIPARARGPKAALLELFCEQAEAVQATVSRLASAEELPEAIKAFLQKKGLLPARIRVGKAPHLKALTWPQEAELSLKQGPCGKDDLIGLSRAVAGVAETGTLILLSGADNPTSLNFLPETHIVALAAQDIAGDYETVWKRLRKEYGKGVLPRHVNMITGPSRSGDIEQTILLGAHGPKTLHIFLIEGGWKAA